MCRLVWARLEKMSSNSAKHFSRSRCCGYGVFRYIVLRFWFVKWFHQKARASHSFRRQCIVRSSSINMETWWGVVSVFYSRQKRKLPGMKIPGRGYSSSSSKVCWCGWRKWNEMRNRIPCVLSAYRFSSFQCVKYIRRAGEGLNARLKEQLWIAANVITSCRRERWWYRSDLSMYYTAAAAGKLVGQFTIHWRMKVPPVDHRRRRGHGHHLICLILRFEMNFWSRSKKKKKGKNQQLSWRVLIKILATITCYRVYITGLLFHHIYWIWIGKCLLWFQYSAVHTPERVKIHWIYT